MIDHPTNVVEQPPFPGGDQLFYRLTIAAVATIGRMFVVEQTTDLVKVFDASGAPRGIFLDLAGKASGSGERGTLSMAFHPDYEQNGWFFVYYTFGSTGSRTRVSGS